jgi:hypothetical protein
MTLDLDKTEMGLVLFAIETAATAYEGAAKRTYDQASRDHLIAAGRRHRQLVDKFTGG